MTRIIAGTVGGRRLRTPPGSGTRPTSDRVREALFSALEARDVLAGATVLDLCAGSGALGLEAASRGATRVDLVESDRRAAKVIADNIRTLGLTAAHTRPTTVATYLGSERAAYQGSEPAAHDHDDHDGYDGDDRFDLVFLDPPYDVGESELAGWLTTLAGGVWLAEGALIVVERSSRSPEPTWPAGWHAEKPRRYGETTLWFATC